MDLRTMERADWRHGQAVRMAERFARAIIRSGFWHNDLLCMPIEQCLVALFPKLFAGPLAPPTTAKPLTTEKVLEMAERFVEGLALFNPDDAELDDAEGFEPAPSPSGKPRRANKARGPLVRQTSKGLRSA